MYSMHNVADTIECFTYTSTTVHANLNIHLNAHVTANAHVKVYIHTHVYIYIEYPVVCLYFSSLIYALHTVLYNDV